MIYAFCNKFANGFLNSMKWYVKPNYISDNFEEGEEIKVDLSKEEIENSLKQFKNAKSGNSSTLGKKAQRNINELLRYSKNYQGNKNLKISEYGKLIKMLSELYLSDAHYCKKEAKELINSLRANARILIGHNDIFSESDKWLIKAYCIIMQKMKPQMIDIGELEKAKEYLNKILVKVEKKQEIRDSEYLAELGIEEFEI
jgi:hypothetical protein